MWERYVSIPSRGSGKGDDALFVQLDEAYNVSIPSRGSGKGDTKASNKRFAKTKLFQSPLGEVVKETKFVINLMLTLLHGFNPLSGKW